MTESQRKAFDFLRRGKSETTELVVVEKPVLKEVEVEVIKEVKVDKDCPPCPECPKCPDKEIHIDTLHIKSDDEINITKKEFGIKKRIKNAESRE